MPAPNDGVLFFLWFKFPTIVAIERNPLLKEKKLLKGKFFFENVRTEESVDQRESFEIDCFNNPFLLRKRNLDVIINFIKTCFDQSSLKGFIIFR